MLDIVYIVIGIVAFVDDRFLPPRLRQAFESAAMTLDYVLGAVVTIGLLGYLVYALIRPERF